MSTAETPTIDDPTIDGSRETFQPSVSPAVRAFTKTVPYVVLAISVVPIRAGYAWILLATFSIRTEGLKPIGGFTLKHWDFSMTPTSGRRP